MFPGALLTDTPSFETNRRAVGPWTATLWTILLVTVAFVPAMAPDATAAEVTTCLPADPRIDASLVLDRSGSMGGQKIEDARDGAIGFVENLTDNDQSGLVSYADVSTVDADVTFDHNTTIQAIENVTSGGGTATGDGIDASHANLEEHGRPGVRPAMIVLSDGNTNEGLDPIEQARQAKEDGIEIFTIAFGSGADEEELKAIASDPVETHFHTASGGDDLETVYDTILEEVDDPTLHAGEGYGLRVNVTNDQSVNRATLQKTPQSLAPPGQEDEIANKSLEAGGVTVEITAAETRASGATTTDEVGAQARSRITDLRVHDGSQTLVEADLLTASAEAWSTPNDEGTNAEGTRVAELTVKGTPLQAPAEPNTAVPLGEDGSLVLNERVATEDGHNTTLRVNALHLTLEDGPRTIEVTAGSAFAAANCGSTPSFAPPQDLDKTLTGDADDDERSAGPATINPGGCSEGTVAASATGCSDGEVAVSGTGDAESTGDHCDTASACVAASGSGDAKNAGGNCEGIAVCAATSGTGDASNAEGECDLETTCVAASGTGDASNAEGACDDGATCVAASGTDQATNTGNDCDDDSLCVAASGTDQATNAGNDCDDGTTCVAASGTGDAANAEGWCEHQSPCLTLAGDGDARNAGENCYYEAVCAAATPTGEAGNTEDRCEDQSVCVAASGTGDATNARNGCADRSTCVAASGTGDATNARESSCVDRNVCAAASGTGETDGDLEATPGDPSDPATLHCDLPSTCVVANPSVGGEAGLLAASLEGDTAAVTGAAVSATGKAETGIGIAASGAHEATTGLGVAVSGTDEADTGLGLAVSGIDDADTGGGVAVSGTGSAGAESGVAVSATGDADSDNGVAVGGCTGLEVENGGVDRGIDSPTPVCPDPVDEASDLLP